MLPKIDLRMLAELQKGQKVTNTKLVNIRGCNGSGKSTIPISMMKSDPYTFEVTWRVGGKERVVATVFPSYQCAALGHYHSKCGGMDSMKTTDEIKDAVKVMWNTNYNLIMEGIMASTVRQTYIDLFRSLNESQELKRDIIIYNILPPIETCISRILQRNGGKAIKEDLVARKWKIVENNVKHFADAGFRSLRVTNENVPLDSVLDTFFEDIGDNKVEMEPSICIDDSCENLSKYEWFEWYKEPDSSVKFDPEYLDTFWNFIYNRLEIYYKRVVLKQPGPWTNDEILSTYRFTNICRDMDKLTLYEIHNILNHLTYTTKDVELQKKSVMFNIMLFRIFVKIDTYECFGFIDFNNPNWRKQWERGKSLVLDRRDHGIRSFTGSFMVNNLKQCNPDPETNSNQTYNALCLCEYILDNIDEVYERTINAKNMKEQLEYLITIPGIGHFTAYEFACSFAMSKRYYDPHTLVPWTQDNYTSIGPGSANGLSYVYKSMGNLSKVEAIIYLRSIWKQEMKRLGKYDQFVKMLPEVLGGELDLRVIEHCLCETAKYIKLSNNTGRVKRRFLPETKDVDLLVL